MATPCPISPLAEVIREIRGGCAPDEIMVVVPRPPRATDPIVAALAQRGVPTAIDLLVTFGSTAFGQALLRFLSVVWDDYASRPNLYAFLRSPWSGVERSRVDTAERFARSNRDRTAEAALADRSLSAVAAFAARVAGLSPLEAVEAVVTSMLANEFRGGARVVTADRGETLAAATAARGALDALGASDVRPTPAELRAVLRDLRVTVRPRGGGRVRVVGLRHVSASAEVVVLAGLVDDPSAGLAPTYLASGQRDLLGGDRDLASLRIYLAVTRARRMLTVINAFADDDGRPLPETSAWGAIRRALPGIGVLERRSLSAIVYAVDEAPTCRDAVRAVVSLAAVRPGRARAIASRHGFVRQLDRASAAFRRPTMLRDPNVRAALAARVRFSVTDLEAYGDCSSIWFVERELSPIDLDRGFDARELGTVAHRVLELFFRGIPARLGHDRLRPSDSEVAIAFVHELLAEALAGRRGGRDHVDVRLGERQLRRDLAVLVRAECEHTGDLVPHHFETSFGQGRNASLDGLQLGDIRVSGKIDRIDVDPSLSAIAVLHDYKSGTKVWSAAKMLEEGRLQPPLYILAARELLGLEPVAAVYRALGGGGATGGMVRSDVDEGARPVGLKAADVVSPAQFEALLAASAAEAVERAQRLRRGDVRHDPRGGSCPRYCKLAGICRVAR